MRAMRPAGMLLAAAALLAAAPALADPLWHATRTISQGEIVGRGDVELRPETHVHYGALPASQSPVGLEAKYRIAAGRVLRERDVGRPALVHANALVRVIWTSPGIAMEMQARALESGSAGDTIRVLNTMTSRTIKGVVLPDGSVNAGGAP